MPPFLDWFRKLLPQPKRYKQLLAQVTPPQAKLGRMEWVLSRPIYRFERFELGSVPLAQRGRALALQIKQRSPYVNTGHSVGWTNDAALVWMWDAESTRSALQAHKLAPRRVRVMPETLLHPPHEKGIFLQACLDGCEGQIWQEQELIFSRWWAKTPDSTAWLSFQRDAGVLPEQQLHDVPQSLAFAWTERPWGKRGNLDDAAGSGGGNEPLFVAAGATALVLTTFWYAANLIKLQQAHELRTAEVRELELNAAPIRLARGQALEELARVKALQSVSAYPDHLSLMAKAAEKLPRNGAYLKEWEYHGGKLKIVVATPNKLSSSEFIKSFQVAGLFENVQAPASSGPTSMTLIMDVIPGAEIKFDAPDADPSAPESNAQIRAEASPGRIPGR